jgi:uncharacterized protein
MFKQFVNRQQELEWLEKNYQKKENNFLIIYGRRRIGKTELIKQFIKDKQHIYFLAGTKPDKENISELQTIMADFLKDDIFNKIQFAGWEELFKEFIKNLKKTIIVTIDEFPYLIEGNKAIPSIFQKIWDEILKDKKIMLILCGSSIGMMETQVLGYKSPLYGRRTGQWKLKPFKFKDLKLIFISSSFEDKLRYFSILDGIPQYLTKMDVKESLTWNLKNRIFKKGEYLYEEAENLLRQEFREPRNYFSILQAISEGFKKYGEICNRTGLNKSLTSQYLSNLIELHIVKKEFPVTQKKESRNANYYLSDNYFDFWFQFIYPNKSLIEEDKQEILLSNISEKLQKYHAFIFEQVCRQFFLDINSSYVKVGRWWYKDIEIDLVGLNEERNSIVFGECKWTNKKIDVDILENLKRKSEYVEWKKNKRKEEFILFSKSGFTKNLQVVSESQQNVKLYNVQRLEKEMKYDKNFKKFDQKDAIDYLKSL